MDPNANLAEQEDILAAMEHDTYEEDHCDIERLAVLRIDLRNWILRGGFVPDWSKAPRASRFFVR